MCVFSSIVEYRWNPVSRSYGRVNDSRRLTANPATNWTDNDPAEGGDGPLMGCGEGALEGNHNRGCDHPESSPARDVGVPESQDPVDCRVGAVLSQNIGGAGPSPSLPSFPIPSPPVFLSFPSPLPLSLFPPPSH